MASSPPWITRSGQAIFAAIIADSAVVWPDLLVIAKNTGAPTANRKDAVFWLSQEAGDAATKGLAELADDEDQDREVRDQAVFAISQLPADKGVPILIRLARSNKDPKVRRKALFWLGQSDDPRALALVTSPAMSHATGPAHTSSRSFQTSPLSVRSRFDIEASP